VEGSPVVGTGNVVYVGSEDKKVYALDGLTGARFWEFETKGKVRSSPAIGLDGVVYVGSEDKSFYALDGHTGAKKWSVVMGGNVESSPAIGSDGTVYVGCWDKKLYAVRSSSLGAAASAWPQFRQGLRRVGIVDLSRIKYPFLHIGD
jgi:outer membrane protein assembly factor BamB